MVVELFEYQTYLKMGLLIIELFVITENLIYLNIEFITAIF